MSTSKLLACSGLPRRKGLLIAAVAAQAALHQHTQRIQVSIAHAANLASKDCPNDLQAVWRHMQCCGGCAHLSGPIAVPWPIQLLPPDMEERRSPRFDSTDPCSHNSNATITSGQCEGNCY